MTRLKKVLARDGMLILLVLPAIIYIVVFHYMPMYGVQIAFRRYSVGKGIWGSPWVGLRWFMEFFQSVHFGRLLGNTLAISTLSILIGFPVPVLFALFLNEVRSSRYKKFIQTVSYLPHFISTVVVVSILQALLAMHDGVINEMIYRLGGEKVNFFMSPEWFRPMYIGSEVWQSYGWNSIVYIAAIAGIDITLYEAANIDGGSRWQNVWYITLPGILPTVGILFILRLGQVMNVGFEKVLLMYNERTYSVADVISTYTYRRGIVDADYSFGAAIGVFNSVINMTLLLVFNWLSKKTLAVSLW